MKTKKMLLLSLAMTAVIAIGGCGVNKTEPKDQSGLQSKVESDSRPTAKKTVETIVVTKESKTEASAEDAKAQETSDIPMVALPEGIKGVKAENVPNEELRDLIVDYMEIPEDFLETTHYYYNYVDLDDDGVDEIFAIVSGPYTSGTGGSSAIWVSNQAGKLHIVQDFTLCNAPVIISDTKKNGFHELIVPYYGNHKNQYSVLSYKNGEYANVPDGKIIDTLDGITGKAIIANDLIKEVEAGIMGFNLAVK